MGAVTAAIIRDGRVLGRVPLDAVAMRQESRDFTWIEACDPADSDFAALQARFGLHSLAVEDSMRPTRFPKVELYGDQIFVVLKSAQLRDDAICYGEVSAFVSRDHIITVRHGSGPGAGQRPLHVQPDFILHAVLDAVVQAYFPVVQMIEEDVLSMEQHLQDALLDRAEITRLFTLRRETLHLRHVLTSMSDACGKLVNLDVPCIGPASKPYFRDSQDRLLRLEAMAKGLVDVIQSVFETSGLLEQQRQGIITRQLAAWAAILGVPAAIAGVHAMVFQHLPCLQAPAVVAGIAGVMLAICAALYVRFRKLGWL